MRIHDGFEKDQTPNKLAYVTVEKSLVEKELKLPTIYVILDEKVDSEKGCCNGFYFMKKI